MVNVKYLRRNPRTYLIVGGVLIVFGLVLCIAPSSIGSFSNYSPPWLMGIFCFVFAGMSMTYGRRLRLLQTLTVETHCPDCYTSEPATVCTDTNVVRNSALFISSTVCERETHRSLYCVQPSDYPHTLESGFIGIQEGLLIPPSYSSINLTSGNLVAAYPSCDPPPPYSIAVDVPVANDTRARPPPPPYAAVIM